MCLELNWQGCLLSRSNYRNVWVEKIIILAVKRTKNREEPKVKSAISRGMKGGGSSLKILP